MISEDCRGLACPAPVIATKKALARAAGAQIRVTVDDGAPQENVLRFAKTSGCTALAEKFEGGWQITLTPDSSLQSELHYSPLSRQAVILIGSDRLGEGPEELGRLLMKNFIITLLELPLPPDTIFFINSGVHLTTSGSELLEPLHKLADMGTELFSCGVCLDYFGLGDKLAAGAVTNMYSIAAKMLVAENSIKV